MSARVDEDLLILGAHVANKAFRVGRRDDLIVFAVQEDHWHANADALIEPDAERVVLLSNRLR